MPVSLVPQQLPWARDHSACRGLTQQLWLPTSCQFAPGTHSLCGLTRQRVWVLRPPACCSLRNESRWMFLNTLFTVSEAVLFCQMVDRLDLGTISPQVGVAGAGWGGRA